VGAFGREVAALAAGTSLVVIDVPELEPAAKDPYKSVVTLAEVELAALLDVTHYLAASSPLDPRGPLCDVFVVADLAEKGVAPVVAPLAAALARGLRRAYSSILRSGQGTLFVSPLLFCPRAGDRAVMGKAAAALAEAAREKTASARLGGRVWLVEDQSEQYLLSRAEMVRSFAAFLSAIALPSVRDDDRGVRKLVEDDGEGAAFSTFACASLVFDHASLRRVASARLGREILALFRTSVDPAATDIASLASPLVPDRMRLEADLAEASPLLEILSPPAIEVPPIEWEDEPETIVERKFGSLFRARAEAKLATFQDEVERFQMDKLAASLEQRGKTKLEGYLAGLDAAVAEIVAAGPTGHTKALLVLRDARTRAKGHWDEVVRAIEAPELSPLPASPLQPKLAALVEATLYRPRPLRLKVLGAVAALVSALLVSGLLVSAYRGLLSPNPPFFDGSAPLPPGRLRPFFTPPVPLLLGSVASAYSIGYRLWKHRKRHHNWVVEARDDLAQSLKRHVREELIGHYEKRLHYARLLWVQRILGRLLGRIEEHIASLEATRAALAEAERALAREEHDATRALSGGGLLTSSVLHAAVVNTEDIDAVYAEVRPPEASAAADRWLRERLEARPWPEAPFAAPTELSAFCHRELAALDEASPFEPGSSALHAAAEASARRFLQRLFLKISPALEVAPKYAPEAPAPLRILFAPAEARKLVEGVLAEGGFAGAWDLRAFSPDRHSIRLIVARARIPLEALALARPEEP